MLSAPPRATALNPVDLRSHVLGSFLFFSHTPVINLGTQSSRLWASHWLADSVGSEPSLAREDLGGQWGGGLAEQAVQVRLSS